MSKRRQFGRRDVGPMQHIEWMSGPLMAQPGKAQLELTTDRSCGKTGHAMLSASLAGPDAVDDARTSRLASQLVGVVLCSTQIILEVVHMQQVQTIGIDLAKNVFQVHGVDENHKVVLVKQLRRNQVIPFFEKLAPCVVGMEACATGHHWARELMKVGHDVRLIPPVYVKAYVQAQQERCS